MSANNVLRSIVVRHRKKRHSFLKNSVISRLGELSEGLAVGPSWTVQSMWAAPRPKPGPDLPHLSLKMCNDRSVAHTILQCTTGPWRAPRFPDLISPILDLHSIPLPVQRMTFTHWTSHELQYYVCTCNILFPRLSSFSPSTVGCSYLQRSVWMTHMYIRAYL